MNKINHSEFKRKIFNKGRFKQYIISPYASEEKFYQKILLFSDRVDQPTIHTFRGKELSLILPFSPTGIRESIKKHLNVIKRYTGVDTTYFGLFDFNENIVLII